MAVNNSRTEVLFELAVMLGQQTDFQEILRVVSETAATLFQSKAATIVMINPSTNNTVKTVIRGGDNRQPHGYQLLQTNMIGWCLKNQKSYLSEALSSDDRFAGNVSAKFEANSAMCVPLQSGGSAIGYLLAIDRIDGKVFLVEDLILLEKMAAIAAPFLDNVQKVQSYFEQQMPDDALVQKYEGMGMLGSSPAYIELLKAIEAAARCEVRVLLTGKSGTGKEKVARAIHRLSSREKQPFVAIDCGAIPEHLIESELFGHVKGAFTGANYDRKGLIEEANKGILFMDEVANLPYDMQAKLLRVLQEGEIRKIGSNKPKVVDVRIISAASRNLRLQVEAGKFREDLFYRLHVYPIQVPTLNERNEDIPRLADHFLQRFAGEQGKEIAAFHEYLLDYMRQRQWPGNIRELENFVERLVALAPEKTVTLDETVLPKEYRQEFESLVFSGEGHPLRKSLQATLEETEADLIRTALIQNGWNQSRAARALQISERAIRYKMEKLGIHKPA